MTITSTMADTLAAGRTERFDTPAFTGFVDRLFQSPPGTPQPGPQAFRIRQDPNTVVPLHFHLQDEWQVVTRGSGTMGRHEMRPILIHYASREAGYGPITAGAEGLDYMTLRPITDPGMWTLPEHRSKMQTGLSKRQLTADCTPELLGPGSHELISLQPDGVAAVCVQAQAGQVAPMPSLGDLDRFLLVVAGAFEDEQNKRLEPLSCIYAAAGEAAPRLVAATPLAAVLVLQLRDRNAADQQAA